MKQYHSTINEIATRKGEQVDPRHVLGFMLLENSTLDHFSKSDFAREFNMFLLMRESYDWELNAKSFGL